MGLIEWLQHGIAHVNRAKRTQQPPLCAYAWGGGSPVARRIKDISSTGAFLYMPESEMWYPGTILTVLLQSESGSAEAAEEPKSTSVSCRVVRHGPDGIGVAFVLNKPEERKSLEQFLRRTLKHEMRAVVTPAPNTQGQALVEFALTVPLLCLLIVNAVNFGAFFFGWITVANAARAGAQYAIMSGASVNSPPQAKASAVSTLITNDFVSLLNGASPTVNICIYNGSTVQASPYQLGTCSGTSSDPEPTHYVGAVVDVTYSYSPPIPLFSFPSLGIRATLPPTTIHRRIYMRMIQ
jgi:Flp pilus assembly protein TadG